MDSNQLMTPIDISYDGLSPTSISNDSLYILSPSISQSVTDSAQSFDMNLFAHETEESDIKTETPNQDPSFQYKISVEPIALPTFLPNIRYSFSSFSSSLASIPSSTRSSMTSMSGSVNSLSSPSDSSVITPINSNNCIQFDIVCGTYMASSNGLRFGYHEMKFKVLKGDIRRQEIGVVSVLHSDGSDGIRNNPKFGARAVYGNIEQTKTFYYASYNGDNSVRCNKRLSSYHSWTNGDVIKVCLDLDKFVISFMINDKKVRKTMSLERNVTYYPIMSFPEGNACCQIDD